MTDSKENSQSNVPARETVSNGFASTEAPAPVAGTAVPSRRRGWIIGGSIAAAATILAGGLGVGAAAANGGTDGHGDEVADNSLVTGVASATELKEIIAAASAVAEGVPVSIDQERDGSWEVELWTATTENEVQVVNGVAKLISGEPITATDPAPLGELDATTLDAVVKAALAASAGTITEAEVDDNTVAPYEVTVRAADGSFIEYTLDSSFAVVTTENEGANS